MSSRLLSIYAANLHGLQAERRGLAEFHPEPHHTASGRPQLQVQ